MALETTSPEAPSLAPIASGDRIRGVDIARGVALLGILLVNTRFFFTPLGSAIDPTVQVPGIEVTTADAIAWSVVEAFCSFKFISLFSMLFGFGLAMQAGRAESSGRARWAPSARRLGLMLAIGLAHGLLVWYGDILTLYACLGVVVVLCARLSARTVLVIAGVVAAVVLLLTIATSALQYAVASFPEPAEPQVAVDAAGADSGSTEAIVVDGSAATTDPTTTDPATTDAATEPARGFGAMLASQFNPRDERWIVAEVAAFREGPFIDAFAFRVANFLMSYVAALFGYGWHALAMMLLGVYALRSGLFASDPEASRRRRRIARISCAVGLPFAIAAPGAFWVFGLESAFAAFCHLILLEAGALILPIGYACIAVEWGPRLPRIVAEALSRTGRMSLTVYLGESLVCTALASWWGLALFGTLADARLALIAVAVWGALVVVASLWLGRFRTGPMEWLWRSATYLRNPG
ncbi:MAG: DUF418 domain-containing protein [Phycisphaerales bacterium]